jgi:hypothetical protein
MSAHPFLLKTRGFEHIKELHDTHKEFWIKSNFKWLKHALNTEVMIKQLSIEIQSQYVPK